MCNGEPPLAGLLPICRSPAALVEAVARAAAAPRRSARVAARGTRPVRPSPSSPPAPHTKRVRTSSALSPSAGALPDARALHALSSLLAPTPSAEGCFVGGVYDGPPPPLPARRAVEWPPECELDAADCVLAAKTGVAPAELALVMDALELRALTLVEASMSEQAAARPA